jgi:hypothetical protein
VDFGHRPYPPAGKEVAQDGQGRSLRAIAAELAELGYFGPSGQPYHPGSIAQMLAR